MYAMLESTAVWWVEAGEIISEQYHQRKQEVSAAAFGQSDNNIPSKTTFDASYSVKSTMVSPSSTNHLVALLQQSTSKHCTEYALYR